MRVAGARVVVVVEIRTDVHWGLVRERILTHQLQNCKRTVYVTIVVYEYLYKPLCREQYVILHDEMSRMSPMLNGVIGKSSRFSVDRAISFYSYSDTTFPLQSVRTYILISKIASVNAIKSPRVLGLFEHIHKE